MAAKCPFSAVYPSHNTCSYEVIKPEALVALSQKACFPVHVRLYIAGDFISVSWLTYSCIMLVIWTNVMPVCTSAFTVCTHQEVDYFRSCATARCSPDGK